MTSPKPIQQILPGEWYWLAIVFGAAQSAYPGIWLSGPLGANGGQWAAYEDETSRDVGVITFTTAQNGRATLIEIAAATAADLQDYWYPAFNRLESYAKEAQELRKSRYTTMDQAVEFYYRSRGPGKQRITLRDVAERFDLSYEALRKHKQRYDARGGWGSPKQDRKETKLDS